MSLTTFLDRADARKRFREEFPKPKLSSQGELRASPLTNHYGLVGSAFDYLLRFLVQRVNPGAKTRTWVAEGAVYGLTDIRVVQKIMDITSQARERQKAFLATGEVTDDLLESAVLLGQIEPIARAWRIDPNLGTADRKDVEDLRNLVSLVNVDNFRARSVCVLNPVFGKASSLIGGADADFVVDDTIIEVKTTKKLELKRDDFNQMMGYYTLYRICCIEGLPSGHEIDKLAVYFSRFGQFEKFDIEDIVNEPRFESFLTWFGEEALRVKDAEDLKRLRGKPGPRERGRPELVYDPDDITDLWTVDIKRGIYIREAAPPKSRKPESEPGTKRKVKKG